MLRSGLLLSIALLLVVLTILTYWHRYPTGDDAWFAEQSYWLQKQGIIRSEFFRGILGWEKQILVSHKLFLLFGAGLIHVFGYQLPVLQCVGLIFFVCIVGQIVYYIYKKENKYDSLYILSILVLIFSNRVLIRMSFENRPELMLAALGFGSFLYVYANKKNSFNSAVAGLLAGMALLAHLNGVIYLIAGVSTLLYFRHYKNAIIFSLAGGITALLYFVDVVQVNDGFSVWYNQFRNDPATQDAFGWYSKLLVLLTYPKLFFQSPEQVALSLLLVYLLWQQRKFVDYLPGFLKIYSLSVLIAFWLITKKSSGTYYPLFMPFMFILAYELFKLRPFDNVTLRIIAGIYLIIGLYGTIEIIYKNNSNEYLPVAYERLRGKLHPAKSGLVPLTFFFNEYEQYTRLLSSENYKHYSLPTNNPSHHMAEWAYSRKVEFILMDYVYRSEFFYPKPGTEFIPYYKLTHYDGRFAIYKLNNQATVH